MKIYFIILGLLLSGCNKSDNQTQNNTSEEVDSLITRFNNPAKLQIENNFPDTLISGDTLIAQITASNDEWHIIKAYSYCPIGEDGVFRTFHRTEYECREFIVEDNKVQIWFITVGTGHKKFDLVTLVFKNAKGEKKASELQINYFLKEDDEDS